MTGILTSWIDKITNFITNLIGNPYVVTEWYWLLLIALGFGVFESIWRRWFGGGFDYKWLRWINFRFIKHCINFIALSAICYYVRGIVWYWTLYAALIFEGLFWTPTFGMYFDIGRSGRPVTPEDVAAYNDSWFHGILDWIFPEKQRYTPYYDYLGMFIRFTAPLLLCFFVPTYNSGILMLGTIVSMVYGLGWVMQEKSLIKKIGPTEFGEFVAGFFAGLYWVISI